MCPCPLSSIFILYKDRFAARSCNDLIEFDKLLVNEIVWRDNEEVTNINIYVFIRIHFSFIRGKMNEFLQLFDSVTIFQWKLSLANLLIVFDYACLILPAAWMISQHQELADIQTIWWFHLKPFRKNLPPMSNWVFNGGVF